MDFAISRNSPDREISFPGTGNISGTRENRVPLTSLVSKKSVTVTINVMERKFHANFTLGNESSRGRKFQGTKVPGNESSRGRKFQRTKVPRNESSTYGTFVPGNESSRVRKFQLPKPWSKCSIIKLRGEGFSAVFSPFKAGS